MKQDLVVLVPTRGRPQNAARLAEGWVKADTLNAHLMFVTDNDDPEQTAYRTLLDEGVIHGLITFDNRTGEGMVGPLNRAVEVLRDAYYYVGFMGDDHMPQTMGWEDRVIEALDTGSPSVVYGNDLFQGRALPTAAFMPSRVLKAMGWMAPPVLRHLYVDNFWKELGEALGTLTYLEDVVIEHLHPAAGKTAMDERYRLVNAPAVDSADRNAWLDFRNGYGFAGALHAIREEYGIQ